MANIKTLGGIGFWCCIIGVAGIGGAIEFGTGWKASLLFIEVGVAALYIYQKKSRGEKKPVQCEDCLECVYVGEGEYACAREDPSRTVLEGFGFPADGYLWCRKKKGGWKRRCSEK